MCVACLNKAHQSSSLSRLQGGMDWICGVITRFASWIRLKIVLLLIATGLTTRRRSVSLWRPTSPGWRKSSTTPTWTGWISRARLKPWRRSSLTSRRTTRTWVISTSTRPPHIPGWFPSCFSAPTGRDGAEASDLQVRRPSGRWRSQRSRSSSNHGGHENQLWKDWSKECRGPEKMAWESSRGHLW